MRNFYLILHREYLLMCRQRGEILLPWLFLLLIVLLFPLGISPQPDLLTTIAPGIIWIGILLGQLLTIEKIFRYEISMGTLEQWMLSPQSFTALIFLKIFSHWLMYCLPLFLCTPLIALSLSLNLHTCIILVFTLLLATPALHFIGALFSAFTVQVRQQSLLLGLLTLPFYVPILIFSTAALTQAQAGLPATVPLALLGAILAFTLSLAPIATTAALRIMLR